MQCADARQLMNGILDDANWDAVQVSPMRAHLDDCQDCDRQWTRLLALDTLLSAQTLIEPPAHFASRATAFVLGEARKVPPWKRQLMVLFALSSAVAGIASVIAGMLHGLGSSLRPELAMAMGESLLRASISVVTGMAAIVAGNGQVWLAYTAMTIVLATLWFAALVLPRSATARSARRR